MKHHELCSYHPGQSGDGIYGLDGGGKSYPASEIRQYIPPKPCICKELRMAEEALRKNVKQ